MEWSNRISCPPLLAGRYLPEIVGLLNIVIVFFIEGTVSAR